MIKFWKEDFTYVKRLDCSIGGYIYIFSVRGESSNYLRNKYDLEYQNIYVNVFNRFEGITVGSENEKLQADIADMEEEDENELLPLLQEEIEIDLRNYEEYLCNDIYPRDARWR
jgi:hypothetical protein